MEERKRKREEGASHARIEKGEERGRRERRREGERKRRE